MDDDTVLAQITDVGEAAQAHWSEFQDGIESSPAVNTAWAPSLPISEPYMLGLRALGTDEVDSQIDDGLVRFSTAEKALAPHTSGTLPGRPLLRSLPVGFTENLPDTDSADSVQTMTLMRATYQPMQSCPPKPVHRQLLLLPKPPQQPAELPLVDQPQKIETPSPKFLSVKLEVQRRNPLSQSYAQPEDWARHKATISRLYRDEGKTLDEVREYMETMHNFRAT